MPTMTVRELPDDLQAFLKADAAANQRSVNKQVIVALQAYRAAVQVEAMRRTTPEEKMAAVRTIQAEVAKIVINDGRTADEIMGYNEYGHFD